MMTFNNIQKIDFNQGLKQLAHQMTSFDINYLDLRGVENRIQQAIGILNFLDNLNVHDKNYKTIMMNTLKKLYQRKKELLYGYSEQNEHDDKLLAYV